MNFGGHLLSGWLVAHSFHINKVSERRIIMIMGTLPDIDGIFTFVPGLGYLHRTFGHNVWVLLLAPVVATFLFVSPPRRQSIYPLLFLSLAIHYLLDIFVTGWWPFMPLYPFSAYAFYMDRYIPQYIMEYYIQLGLLLILLIPAVVIAVRHHRTPLEIISVGFDGFIQDFVTLPWTHHCSYCGRRAFYRCSECGRVICGVHCRFATRFRPVCSPQCHAPLRAEK
ncbi:metal-dependent hydrolase [Candidatus Sumerlaeota bacterium]|nr:metal-dependent hydrolase [Candidatus Sumerlaeota bacterium]